MRSLAFAFAFSFSMAMTGTGTASAAEPGKGPPGEKEFTGCHKYPESKRFHWGVRGEVGLPELVASLGEIGCQAIVVGPAAAGRGGKVTLEVPDLLTSPEVYRLFYAALESLGLTVETSGKTLKVVASERAREVSKLLGREATPGGDQFVTRLVRVEHAGVQEIGDLAGRLRSKEGDVTVYAPGSALIVTDRGEVVRRIEALVRELDVAGKDDKIWTLTTHGQSPTELAATVEKVLSAGRKPASPDGKSGGPRPADGVSAVVPVDAAHMLVVVGGEVGFRRVAALAARLDPAPDEGGEAVAGGQAHVVYLAHTNAEDIAATLRDVGLAGRGGAAVGGRPGATAAVPLQGDVRIAADKVSNAIVVFAGSADFQMVRELVGKLDVPRRQVYVEATILDLSVDRSRDLGLAFHGGADLGNGITGAASDQASSLNTLIVDEKSLVSAFAGAGLTGGILGPAMQIAGVSLPSFGVLVRALEHSKDVNIISRPHLLTMDNTKAALSVGQSIPFQTQAMGTAATAVPSVLSTYARQDVALKLELTPHLNDSDSIRLELDGEISDVPDGQSTAQAGGPTTNKRTLKTAIVVGDGETVVLGGLQKDGQSESVSKIPFLGDIPILGKLFQYKSKSRTKQDLLIILTPYVIRGKDDLRRIHERKEAERREFLERYTAFKDDAAYDPHVDYRRKRGLLEEINLTAKAAELEARAVRDAEKALKRPPPEGPIVE
jgi:general secretion pathway protein D